MKIFVTVGTTRFDSLIRHIITTAWFKNHSCTLQVGPGGPKTDLHECFDYTKRIAAYYKDADVVVTHAGAGTIYELLAMRKPFVIVPNTDRVDAHQRDIAHFMHKNQHSIAVENLQDLVGAIQCSLRLKIVPFTPPSFFAAAEIVDFFVDPAIRQWRR